MIVYQSADLAALAAAGGVPAEFSPLGDAQCLVFALDGNPLEKSARWLRGLACPVIALGDVGDPGAAPADIVVPDADAAGVIADRIATHPVAATVFVRLLRVTESMPLDQALEVESLAYATLQAGAEYSAWLLEHRAAAPAKPTDEGPAVLHRRDGATLELVLNRPSNRNAMSMEMRDALIEALVPVAADPSIASLRLRGRGACFSTGGDLTEFGLVPDPATGHIVRALSLPGRALASCAARATIAVHGACIGSGIEFPAFAGRIEASADAWFQLPEIGFGLIPGAGGCISIARRIGRRRLAWMGLSGQRIDAQTALDWGLVDALVASAPEN